MYVAAVVVYVAAVVVCVAVVAVLPLLKIAHGPQRSEYCASIRRSACVAVGVCVGMCVGVLVCVLSFIKSSTLGP